MNFILSPQGVPSNNIGQPLLFVPKVIDPDRKRQGLNHFVNKVNEMSHEQGFVQWIVGVSKPLTGFYNC